MRYFDRKCYLCFYQTYSFQYLPFVLHSFSYQTTCYGHLFLTFNRYLLRRLQQTTFLYFDVHSDIVEIVVFMGRFKGMIIRFSFEIKRNQLV